MIPMPGYRNVRLTAGPRLGRSLAALAAIAAATVLVMGAIAAHGGSSACASSSAAARAFDLQVSGLPGVDLAPVLDGPGVSASSGPYPGVNTAVRHGTTEVGVWLEGRRSAASVVGRPAIARGTWARRGSVVLERGLARTLHAGVGARVTVATSRGPAHLRVAGIATTTSPRRMASAGGLAYASISDLSRVAPDPHVHGSTVLVQLSDRSTARSFARWLEDRYPGPQIEMSSSFDTPCVTL